MIKSMTGYGCAKGCSDKINITIELRSVNNRFLDCSIRIPRVYTAIEDSIKTLVGKYVSRGKVDVYVTLDSSAADDTVITVNETLAEAYIKAFAQIADDYGIPNDITTSVLTKFPDILHAEKKEEDTDVLYADILAVLDEALHNYDSMRSVEGDKLREDVLNRLDTLENLVSLAEKRSPETLIEYKNRLETKMREVLETTGIDEQRIVTEAAIFADKIAVDEETVRLRSHISQVRSMMESAEPVGRKLDFIVQEMNRESNTIGSKGNDLQMAKIVVDMKSTIEKIREQIQNIE